MKVLVLCSTASFKTAPCNTITGTMSLWEAGVGSLTMHCMLVYSRQGAYGDADYVCMAMVEAATVQWNHAGCFSLAGYLQQLI